MTRLLVITQKVNKADPGLSFFVGWIQAFLPRFRKVSVICLEKGPHDLPESVEVHSLGKESKPSRLRYVINFYQLLWRLRGTYDAVFVHMNQEYVLLAGLLWRLTGKRVYMWRNHHAGSLLTDLAARFCTKVFCTSKFSYTAKYSKTVLMPVGIDEGIFYDRTLSRTPRSILFLSRMAPVKKPHVLLDALLILAEKGVEFSATFCGDSLPADREYHEGLKERAAKLSGKVSFMPGVANILTPELYGKHEIFVNLSSSGMFDKTIFEAMLSGCVTLASNRNLQHEIGDRFVLEHVEAAALAEKLAALLALSPEDRDAARAELGAYARRHTLAMLAAKLENELQ
jgi:glycosyltransferase involved in cell wall biosynthesis